MITYLTENVFTVNMCKTSMYISYVYIALCIYIIVIKFLLFFVDYILIGNRAVIITLDRHYSRFILWIDIIIALYFG